LLHIQKLQFLFLFIYSDKTFFVSNSFFLMSATGLSLSDEI
jgi:hypothetical protein